MPTVRISQDEIKRLRDLVISSQIDPVREAKLCDFLAEFVPWSVAKRVSVKNSRIEFGPHEIEFLEVHQPLFVHAKPVSDDLAV